MQRGLVVFLLIWDAIMLINYSMTERPVMERNSHHERCEDGLYSKLTIKSGYGHLAEEFVITCNGDVR